MGHISALGLFDYLAGKADLTTEETDIYRIATTAEMMLSR